MSGLEIWLRCRGYEVMPREKVSIEGYEPPAIEMPPLSAEPLYNGTLPLDANLPHLLELRFANTVTVRVLEAADGRQLFLFVRNYTPTKFKKKDLFALCNDFVPLADCVLFSSRLPPQSSLTCLQTAVKHKHGFEMLHLPEARYDKLKNRGVPKCLLFNDADIKRAEKTYGRSRTRFPKIRLSYHDAMARYLGWKVGMVIYEPRSQIYRLVVP